MDEILTTARDLELEVNEDDIEELIMGHADERTIEELQEILNEEHQEKQRNVSPSEQEEDERGPMPASAIKDILKKWEAVRAMLLEWHPNQADISRSQSGSESDSILTINGSESDSEITNCFESSKTMKCLRSHQVSRAIIGIGGPHTSRGVISEPDQLTTSEAEILDGFSDQDCNLEQKCVNCSQPHSADSKLCHKWKIEKEIQTIKTNKNIYVEARKLIAPQPSQTYAQATKSITVNNSSQTEKNITKIKCPPLKLLQWLSSLPKPNTSISTPAISTSSSSTQAQLLTSTSSIAATLSKPEPPTPIPNDALSKNMFTSIESFISTSLSNASVQPPSVPTTKQNSKGRA
ncbi:uncharacterized protein TNCV_5025431 [Trichonephila clavipes]|nr:uncharacterized protein TNCV_5025431 [Trichonephila clavipes]